MGASMEIRVSVKQGPITLKATQGVAIDNNYSLWNGITATELFPATEDTGNYELTLQKNVETSNEVDGVEQELLFALRRLSYAWPFAGGSILNIEPEQIGKVKVYESNAEKVRELLIEKEGKKLLRVKFNLNIEQSAIYASIPLESAIMLCKEAEKDYYLEKMLKYYYNARTDTKKWFIDLYKVREKLCDAFGCAKNARETLGISDSAWRIFGKVLNNYDLRHALNQEDEELEKKLDQGEINRVIEYAYDWIKLYIAHKL